MVAELAALPVFAWLVTYALHSTLLLGAAWLVSRRLDPRALALRERLWKFAVLGGFATAAVQVGAGIDPLLGRVELALAADPEVVPAARPEGASAHAPQAERHARLEAALAAIAAPRSDAVESPGAEELPATAPTTAPTITTTAVPITATPATLPAAAALGIALDGSLPLFALGSWIVAVLASAGLVAFGLGRLRRELSGAVELEHGPVAELLRRLAASAPGAGRVRLLVAPRLTAPLSTGWRRPRICLPPRALDELSSDELAAVLAHEVAHLARRDPPWLFLLWWIETVCFFQPLNRLARRELSSSFELSADAWAARATGDRLALAACLARIAGWVVGAHAPGAQRALGAAMADALDADRPRSRLGQRILRLLDEGELACDERAGSLERAAGLAVLAGLALAVPGAAAVMPALERAAAELAPELAVPAPTHAAPAPARAAPAPGERDAGGAVAIDPSVALEEIEVLDPSDAALTAEALFDGLDVEMEALSAEIGLLRAELSGVDPDPRWSSALKGLEARALRLEDRRHRMQVVLEAILAQDPAHDARRFGP